MYLLNNNDFHSQKCPSLKNKTKQTTEITFEEAQIWDSRQNFKVVIVNMFKELKEIMFKELKYDENSLK